MSSEDTRDIFKHWQFWATLGSSMATAFIFIHMLSERLVVIETRMEYIQQSMQKIELRLSPDKIAKLKRMAGNS